MDKNTVMIAIIALLVGLIAGFLLANSMNRAEMNNLRVQGVPQIAQPNSNSQPDAALTDEELKAKIAEADKNPSNFGFQKELGIALYRYAALQQDVNILNESVRILERANSLNSRDFDVLVSLGNGHFDIGFNKKDASRFQKARDIYAEALRLQPDDADVQTDIGISYYWQPSPDYNKAVAQLDKVVNANPTHTRPMQYLARAHIKLGRFSDAEKIIAKIREIDPNEQVVAALTAEITEAKGGQIP